MYSHGIAPLMLAEVAGMVDPSQEEKCRDALQKAVKLIIGAGQALDGRLLIYDGLKAEARTVEVAADPACRACAG